MTEGKSRCPGQFPFPFPVHFPTFPTLLCAWALTVWGYINSLPGPRPAVGFGQWTASAGYMRQEEAERSGCLSFRLHFYWVTSDRLHPATEVHNSCWVDFSYSYSLLILASDSCPCSFRYRDNTTTPRFLALGYFTILISPFHVVNTPFFKLT